MLQVFLSTVSVYWRYIRPFLNFEIQIWSLAALCNGRKCRLRRSAAFAFCFFFVFFFFKHLQSTKASARAQRGCSPTHPKGANCHRYMHTARAQRALTKTSARAQRGCSSTHPKGLITTITSAPADRPVYIYIYIYIQYMQDT